MVELYVPPINEISTTKYDWTIEAKVLKTYRVQCGWTKEPLLELILEDSDGTKIQAYATPKMLLVYEKNNLLNQWFKFNTMYVFETHGWVKLTVNKYKLKFTEHTKIEKIPTRSNLDYYDFKDLNMIHAGITKTDLLIGMLLSYLIYALKLNFDVSLL